MLSSVDLPQPEGPRMQTNSPGLTVKVALSSAFQPAFPPLPGKNLESRSISMEAAAITSLLLLYAPLQRAPFEELPLDTTDQHELDEQHDEEEQERVRQHLAHVEHLVVVFDLVSDAVAAAEQLDEQHHLPDQAEAEARRRHQHRRDLRRHDRADDGGAIGMVGLRHVDQLWIDALDARPDVDGEDRH